jgi:aminobenzoyl-glutamate utilization protein B
MSLRALLITSAIAFELCIPATAQQPVGKHQQILELVDQHATQFSRTSKTIWDYAELGYQEEKSTALLQGELQSAGFHIQAGVAEEPTAFVATFGQGEAFIFIEVFLPSVHGELLFFDGGNAKCKTP